MCECQLGRAVPPEWESRSFTPAPNTVDQILKCLKRIHNSVDFWTKHGGSQGYLSYVTQFMP